MSEKKMNDLLQSAGLSRDGEAWFRFLKEFEFIENGDWVFDNDGWILCRGSVGRLVDRLGAMRKEYRRPITRQQAFERMSKAAWKGDHYENLVTSEKIATHVEFLYLLNAAFPENLAFPVQFAKDVSAIYADKPTQPPAEVEEAYRLATNALHQAVEEKAVKDAKDIDDEIESLRNQLAALTAERDAAVESRAAH